MRLFLIRHGETEHNVAGLLAGVTDSILTNHGVLQTQRLGKFLAQQRRLQFSQIFASDLQRAHMTAEAIRHAQTQQWPAAGSELQVIKLDLLREQDFGSFELVPWSSKRAQDALDPRVPDATDPSFKPKETPEAMRARADAFLDDFMLPLLALDEDTNEESVAIVSHGLFLATLWRTLLSRFEPHTVSLGPAVESASVGRPLGHMPAWTNTGYLELDIAPLVQNDSLPSIFPAVGAGNTTNVTKLHGYRMTVRAVNEKQHLQSLKRAGGGIGSATYDSRQRNLEGFFKRARSN